MGTPTYNATITVGSNQMNEWSLLGSLCYGQTVDLNFTQGIFYLYSSNGVNSVIQTYMKYSDQTTADITMGTSRPSDILHSHVSLPSSTSKTLTSSIRGLRTLMPNGNGLFTNGPPPNTHIQLLHKNRGFPAVDIYCPNDTQQNTSVNFFIFSNIADEIEIFIKFGDGTEHALKQFSGSEIISHSYQKSGNMTAHFLTSHK